MTESMSAYITDSVKAGFYIVKDEKQGTLNGSTIHITEILDKSPGNSIKSRKEVQGTITFSEKYPYKKTAELGDSAFIFESTYDKNILLTDWKNNLINAIIVPLPTNEGGRRRKTLRNKRKLRLRKTKSSNKTR